MKYFFLVLTSKDLNKLTQLQIETGLLSKIQDDNNDLDKSIFIKKMGIADNIYILFAKDYDTYHKLIKYFNNNTNISITLTDILLNFVLKNKYEIKSSENNKINDLPNTQVWTTLIHNGLYFPYISLYQNQFGEYIKESNNNLMLNPILTFKYNNQLYVIKLTGSLLRISILYAKYLIKYMKLTQNTDKKNITLIKNKFSLNFLNGLLERPLGFKHLLIDHLRLDDNYKKWFYKESNWFKYVYWDNIVRKLLIPNPEIAPTYEGEKAIGNDGNEWTSKLVDESYNILNGEDPDYNQFLIWEKDNKDNFIKECCIQAMYGFASINGLLEKISNCKADLESIYEKTNLGELSGCIRQRILPEDVIVNSSPPGPQPPMDRNWKNIIEDRNKSFLSCWEDKINIGTILYSYIDDNNVISNRLQDIKFDIAREFNIKYDEFRKFLINLLENDELKSEPEYKVLVAIWLLLTQGFNIDTRESYETVGICGLRPSNVTIHKNSINQMKVMQYELEYYLKDIVHFCFPLKNGLWCNRYVEMIKPVCDALEYYRKQAKCESYRYIFNSIDNNLINKFLQTIFNSNSNIYIDGKKIQITSKDIRCQLACRQMNMYLSDACQNIMLYIEQLNQLQVEKQELIKLKAHLEFKKANINMAIFFNHYCPSRKLTKKRQTKLNRSQQRYKQAQFNSGTYNRKRRIKIPDTPTMYEKLKSDLEQEKIDLKISKYSLRTSIDNYIDPRIIVSWSEYCHQILLKCGCNENETGMNFRKFSDKIASPFCSLKILEEKFADFIGTTPNAIMWNWNESDDSIINFIIENIECLDTLKLYEERGILNISEFLDVLIRYKKGIYTYENELYIKELEYDKKIYTLINFLKLLNVISNTQQLIENSNNQESIGNSNNVKKLIQQIKIDDELDEIDFNLDEINKRKFYEYVINTYVYG